jgi:hypothetical protein
MPPYAGQVPQFGPPPRFAPGYAYAGHAPKKSNAGAITAVVMVGVFVVVGGLIATFALSGSRTSHVADAGYQSYPTSATTYSSPTSSSSTTTSTSRTTSTTSTRTTTGQSTSEAPETPDTPSGPQPSAKLADNPLFVNAGQGLPNVKCRLSRWADNPSASEAFFRSALPCLDSAWKAAMDYAGLPFHSPKLAFPTGSNWSSPCGDVSNDDAAAFYCSADETLYMPFAGLRVSDTGAHPGVYLAVFAHEYGHHVQKLAGLMDTADQKRYDAGADTDAGLEFSRRLELQAQCFSGMFLGSEENRGGDIDTNIYNEGWNSEDRGDGQRQVRDHGTNAHAESWWQQGAQSNRLQQCNTWAASPSDVA